MNTPEILARWRDEEARKQPWNAHWEDLSRLMSVRRMGFVSTPEEGGSRVEDLFDGSPMQAARGLANALGGLLRPEGQDWFKLRVDDDQAEADGAAQEWLAQSEEELRDAVEAPQARFGQATGEADLDLVVLGTAILYVGDGKRPGDLLYQSIALTDGTPLFDEDGNAEGMFRRRRFTVRQAMARFGEDALSEETRKKASDKRVDEKVEFLHAVLPREGGREDALIARNMPFAAKWIEVQAKHSVEEGGFHELPFVVPRFDTSSGETYGRSPAMIALPDAQTLQAMGETLLVTGQRAADPPLFAPNDGAFSEVNTFPGGLSYYDVETAVSVRGNPFFSLDTGSNMPLTREMQQDYREQVRAAFYRNVLNMPTEGPQMTATEVMQRKEEYVREIGAVYGRLSTDYTAPKMERSFKILLRNGRLPPIPESLEGRRVAFEYDSPVKRMREEAAAFAAAEWASLQAQRAEIWPEAADVVDVEALARVEAKARRLPFEVVASADAVAAKRKQRQGQATAAQEAALVQEGASAADKAASALQKVSA